MANGAFARFLIVHGINPFPKVKSACEDRRIRRIGDVSSKTEIAEPQNLEEANDLATTVQVVQSAGRAGQSGITSSQVR